MPSINKREHKQLILDLLELVQNQCELTKHAIKIGHYALAKHEMANSLLALQLALKEYEQACQDEEK